MKKIPSALTPQSQRNPHFYLLASAAVKAEQHGQFSKAADLWSGSMEMAIKASNKIWSEHRQAYCLSAIRNGWSAYMNNAEA